MTDSYQPPSTNLRPQEAGLYSVRGIVIGTILGSLAAGIVMLFLNYRALGEAGLAKRTAIWGSLICVVVVILTSFAPNTTAIALLFMVLQATIAYFLADRLQAATIAYHQQHGRLIHSSMRAAGVGLLAGMAIIFALVAVSVLLAIIIGVPTTTPAG